jgi:uracil-DNA glycosylase family 4
VAILPKPSSCSRCALERIGRGFSRPSGPLNSALYFLGESLGAEEVWQGQAFVGPAGTMLNRVLYDAGIPRDSLRIGNLVSCQPPENKLDKWQAAIERCNATYLQPDLERWLESPSPTGEKVVVALGGHAMRNILNLQRKGTRVQDFHGSVIRDPTDRFNVVCTYHPSFLQRGAFNLIDVMRYDLTVAKEAAIEGFVPEQVALFLDPTFSFFEHWANEYIAAATRDPDRTWLAVDIETPDKAKKTDEGELKLSDRSYQIIRINFSYNTDEAVTVPWSEPYIRVIKRILAAPGAKIFWNAPYDVPRLRFNNAPVAEPILDFMWAWHVLQSDLPRGLGFVAPFYSKLGPWKHWSADDPVRYAAMDAVQTLRIAYGVAEQLEQEGMWDVFWRHVYELDTKVLHPAEDVGLLVDLEELGRLKTRLDETAGRIAGEVQALVPSEVKPLIPKGGLAKHPGVEYYKDEEGNLTTEEIPIYEAEVKVIGKVCEACGAEQITVKHRCKDKALQPKVVARELTVKRYYRQDRFNPGSPHQLMAYILHRGHTPGLDKKTKKPTTNKDSLDKLIKSTDDPLYPKILELRSVDKVRKTYVNGSYDKLRTDPRSVLDGRLHPSFLHKPSSLRLSCQSPNLQNVIADRGAYTSLAGGFRFCLVAAPGCKLLEVDFSGIEAVLSGWFMGDPRYIRMAKLSIHAFVTSHLVGEPPEDSWDDAQLASWFGYIKEKYPQEYNQCKRYVHGTNYGLTIFGMVKQFPKEFPTIKAAERIAAIYAKVAPGLEVWHAGVRNIAAKETRLGGSTHPFGYRHWFYNVMSYQAVKGVARKGAVVVRMGGQNFEVKLGEDAKRAVSFFPQSTAAGIIKEAMLRLFDPEMPNYIGDAFYGRTPLRAQIHDSLLLEVPDELLDIVLEKLVIEMTRPIPELPMPEEWGLGEYLSIGVEAKVGQNWANYNDKPEDKEGRPLRLNLGGMKKVALPNLAVPTLAGDVPVPFDEYDEAEEEAEAEEYAAG